MNSPYNMVVNIVNVESPFEDDVKADGLDQINKLVKSILIRNNFEFFIRLFAILVVTKFSNFWNSKSLFEKSFNAKYLFILEGSNTAQVYQSLSGEECPSWTNLQNGLMTVDSAIDGQKAIPSKLAR